MKAMTEGERERILQLYQRGWTTARIAGALGRSASGCRRIRQRFRERGTLQPTLTGRGRKLLVNDQQLAALDEVVQKKPDATLEELLISSGLGVSRSTLDRYLKKRLKLSFKKKVVHAAEQHRADVAAGRQTWKQEQASWKPEKLVFIDETWCKTNMTRRRGRARIGERLVEHVPFGHWKTTTLVAALSLDGIRCSETIDGAINGDHFVAFCRQILGPTLKPGDIVIADNLSSHKSVAAREAIEACGAELWFLPPYSPDLNPIEPCFSKIRRLFESVAHRTIDAMWRDTQRLLDCVTASDARGFFGHCGYSIAT